MDGVKIGDFQLLMDIIMAYNTKEKQQNWYKDNQERIREKSKLWNIVNSDHKKEIRLNYKINKPWMKSWSQAKQRCNNPNDKGYKNYGAKGIKFLLNKVGIEKLWFRDEAYNMVKPSIDRKNKNKDYTLENCQFIEMEINRIKDSEIKIDQYDLNDKFIKTWKSLNQIRRVLNISHVWDVIHKKRKTAGVFKWRIHE